MKLWTFAELNQKVRADLDLQDQIFITPDEMVGYVNEAIHEAESEIMKINEDYFLQTAPLALVAGTSLYSLPADIYGQKIRAIIYSQGSVQYPIKRVRGGAKFETLTMIDTYGTNDDYMYLLVNTSPGTQNQIRITPTSRETSASNVTLWYIRSAQRVKQASEQIPVIQPTAPNSAAQLATILDIPEFSMFLIDFVKCKCLMKDTDPRLPDQIKIMESQRQMMIQSLTEQVPDDDNFIQPDMSFYTQSS